MGLRLRPYLLLLPSLIFLVLFTYLPVVRSIFDSLFDTRLSMAVHYVGWNNYLRLFHDSIFWQALLNNLLYIIMTMIPSLVLALLLALALRRNSRFNQCLRAVIFMPMVLPLVSVATLFLFVYLPSMGLLDYYLSQLFGWMNNNYLGVKSSALIALAAIGIWKFTGYYMLFFLAGLQSIDDDIIAAARMEGANRWQIFWSVTLPLLRPTLNFVVIVAFIYAVTQIDHVAVMTQGGPNQSTNVLLYYITQLATQTNDYGKASAATFVLLIVMMVITVVNLRLMEKGTHYERS